MGTMTCIGEPGDGAKGHIHKSATVEQMVAAISAVHNGGTHYSREIADILLQQNRHEGSTLTNCEQTTISLLASGHPETSATAYQSGTQSFADHR